MGQVLHLLRADSHRPETLNEARGIIGDRHIDFLFIDGDYTYEGVRKYYEMYSPLVENGGIIAFHDICPSLRVTSEMFRTTGRRIARIANSEASSWTLPRVDMELACFFFGVNCSTLLALAFLESST